MNFNSLIFETQRSNISEINIFNPGPYIFYKCPDYSLYPLKSQLPALEFLCKRIYFPILIKLCKSLEKLKERLDSSLSFLKIVKYILSVMTMCRSLLLKIAYYLRKVYV